jgi:ATP-binding cassette subfamily F protein 3
VLVHDGTAQDYDGSIDDYIRFVLAGDDKPAAKGEKVNKKEARRLAAQARENGSALRKQAKASEAEVARLTGLRAAIERTMFDPASADPALTGLTMTDLMKRRADVERLIETAERDWLQASEALEAIAA